MDFKMSKILITPKIGTARFLEGRMCVGGTQYALADDQTVEVRNNLALGLITKLEGVKIDEKINSVDFYQLVREMERDKPRDVENESSEDYFANIHRFAAEALSSKSEDTSETEMEENKPKTTRKVKPTEQTTEQPTE
jgi:hypothetical protein